MNTLKERCVPVMGGRSRVRLKCAAAARSAGASVTIASRSEPKLKGAAPQFVGNAEGAVPGTNGYAAKSAKDRTFNAPNFFFAIKSRADAIGTQHQSLATARFLADSDSQQERHKPGPARIRILT